MKTIRKLLSLLMCLTVIVVSIPEVAEAAEVPTIYDCSDNSFHVWTNSHTSTQVGGTEKYDTDTHDVIPNLEVGTYLPVSGKKYYIGFYNGMNVANPTEYSILFKDTNHDQEVKLLQYNMTSAYEFFSNASVPGKYALGNPYSDIGPNPDPVVEHNGVNEWTPYNVDSFMSGLNLAKEETYEKVKLKFNNGTIKEVYLVDLYKHSTEIDSNNFAGAQALVSMEEVRGMLYLKLWGYYDVQLGNVTSGMPYWMSPIGFLFNEDDCLIANDQNIEYDIANNVYKYMDSETNNALVNGTTPMQSTVVPTRNDSIGTDAYRAAISCVDLSSISLSDYQDALANVACLNSQNVKYFYDDTGMPRKFVESREQAMLELELPSCNDASVVGYRVTKADITVDHKAVIEVEPVTNSQAPNKITYVARCPYQVDGVYPTAILDYEYVYPDERDSYTLPECNYTLPSKWKGLVNGWVPSLDTVKSWLSISGYNFDVNCYVLRMTEITSQPVHTQVAGPASVSFSIAATGDNLSYDWYLGEYTDIDYVNRVTSCNNLTYDTSYGGSKLTLSLAYGRYMNKSGSTCEFTVDTDSTLVGEFSANYEIRNSSLYLKVKDVTADSYVYTLNNGSGTDVSVDLEAGHSYKVEMSAYKDDSYSASAFLSDFHIISKTGIIENEALVQSGDATTFTFDKTSPYYRFKEGKGVYCNVRSSTTGDVVSNKVKYEITWDDEVVTASDIADVTIDNGDSTTFTTEGHSTAGDEFITYQWQYSKQKTKTLGLNDLNVIRYYHYHTDYDPVKQTIKVNNEAGYGYANTTFNIVYLRGVIGFVPFSKFTFKYRGTEKKTAYTSRSKPRIKIEMNGDHLSYYPEDLVLDGTWQTLEIVPSSCEDNGYIDISVEQYTDHYSAGGIGNHWFFDGLEFKDLKVESIEGASNWYNIPGATESQLVVTPSDVWYDSSSYFRCKVYGYANSATTNEASLTINNLPVNEVNITELPEEQHTFVGDDFTISVGTDDNDLYDFEWHATKNKLHTLEGYDCGLFTTDASDKLDSSATLPEYYHIFKDEDNRFLTYGSDTTNSLYSRFGPLYSGPNVADDDDVNYGALANLYEYSSATVKYFYRTDLGLQTKTSNISSAYDLLDWHSSTFDCGSVKAPLQKSQSYRDETLCKDVRDTLGMADFIYVTTSHYRNYNTDVLTGIHNFGYIYSDTIEDVVVGDNSPRLTINSDSPYYSSLYTFYCVVKQKNGTSTYTTPNVGTQWEFEELSGISATYNGDDIIVGSDYDTADVSVLYDYVNGDNEVIRQQPVVSPTFGNTLVANVGSNVFTVQEPVYSLTTTFNVTGKEPDNQGVAPTPTPTPTPTSAPTQTLAPTQVPSGGSGGGGSTGGGGGGGNTIIIVTVAPSPTPEPSMSPMPTPTSEPSMSPTPVPTSTPVPTAKPKKDVPVLTVSATPLGKKKMKINVETTDDVYYVKLMAAPCDILGDGFSPYDYNCTLYNTVNNNIEATIDRIYDAKMQKGTYYKFHVVAYDKNGRKLRESNHAHATTKGGEWGEEKNFKFLKQATKVKKGKTLDIKVQYTFNKPVMIHDAAYLSIGWTKGNKSNQGVRYYVSKPNLATIIRSGRLKAKKRGKLWVYAVTQSGKRIRLRIRIK